MQVIWSPQARAEFRKAIAHIAKDNPYAARRVQGRIEAFADALGAFPRQGTPGQALNTHESVIPGLPYTIVYEETPEVVYLLRLWHHSRRRKGRRQSLNA